MVRWSTTVRPTIEPRPRFGRIAAQDASRHPRSGAIVRGNTVRWTIVDTGPLQDLLRISRHADDDQRIETGCRSDGERLITFSTSAVAVCRSSASCGLVEQPHVLDGDHGLVGEGLQQLDVDALKTGRASFCWWRSRR